MITDHTAQIADQQITTHKLNIVISLCSVITFGKEFNIKNSKSSAKADCTDCSGLLKENL